MKPLKYRDKNGNNIFGIIFYYFIIIVTFIGAGYFIINIIKNAPEPPKRICDKSNWMIERRFAVDIDTGTKNQNEARKLAGESRIYLGQNCYYK